MYIIEWFVQNVIGKGAEFFVSILLTLWRILKPVYVAIDKCVAIGFWPSLILVLVSLLLWNGISYYELTKQRNRIKANGYRKKRKIFLRWTTAQIVLAFFALIKIYEGWAPRAYWILAMCYIAVFVKVVFFIVELSYRREPKPD